MSSPEFFTQAQPGDFLREAILRHVRYTLVRPTSELKPSDYPEACVPWPFATES